MVFKFPQTGLKFQDLTVALALNNGLSAREGLLVESVEPNSPGDRAGLDPNDVIVAVEPPLWPTEELAPEPDKRRNPLEKGRIDFITVSSHQSSFRLASSRDPRHPHV